MPPNFPHKAHESDPFHRHSGAGNEERTIHLILDKIKAVQLVGGLQKEVILTNDCSRDDTEGAIQRYMAANPEVGIRYLKHDVNRGKGAALHTGIQHATGQYIIIQDADLEYDPAEYNILLRPILDWLRRCGLWLTVHAAGRTASCFFGTASATNSSLHCPTP